MFTNLIESNSHKREFKRRGSFFLITVAAYSVILFAAGIASVYAYDAQLEAQTSNELLIDYWVPPVARETPRQRETRAEVVRRSTPTSAPIDRHIITPVRPEGIASTNDPTKVPDRAGTQSSPIPPITGQFKTGPVSLDPPSSGPDVSRGCATCSGATSGVRIETDAKPPEPTPVKPTTQRVNSVVLNSKVISLPQPTYPAIAKQTGTQGVVGVQILVDEQGRVISAQTVSGHPFLVNAAKEAAMRARFTPTVLNGVPVKIQGVITYNFVLQ